MTPYYAPIATPCPSCGKTTMFVDPKGNLACAFEKCPQPVVRKAIDELKEKAEKFDEINEHIRDKEA